MLAENKYRRCYKRLMARSMGRKLNTYSERHHVMPRALGGGNKRSNIAVLTYREHFLSHWLVVKFTEGRALRQMQSALHTPNGAQTAGT